MPNPKRARNEPSEKKSKPKLQKPKLEQAKPAPKYKQPKMSDFLKKFETSKLPAFSNGKKNAHRTKRFRLKTASKLLQLIERCDWY